MALVANDITIQHWQVYESLPLILEQSGYKIINSLDWWGYTSLKSDHTPILPAPYPQYLSPSRTLNFGGEKGLQWTPRFTNQYNVEEKLQSGGGGRGAVTASWNDNGPDASTQLEAFYAVREGWPVLAARMWAGDRGEKVAPFTMRESIEKLARAAPGQNLDRTLEAGKDGLIVDWRRGELGLGAKGMDYTLKISYSGDFGLSSEDARLVMKNGVLEFETDGFVYSLRMVSV